LKRVSLRELASGSPAPDRIALFSLWFRDHNNPRYAELVPRLDRLDAALLMLPAARIPRALGFRAFVRTKPLVLHALLGRAGARYRNLLTLDFGQLPHWPGAAVMDADDPSFSEREIALMKNPSLRAYVVTAERTARVYESHGVEKPWVVIPQGVNLTAATDELRRRAGARKGPGEVVLGWMAAHLLTDGDRDAGNALYNVDHLLELWDEIHARVPNGRLWLVGGPSERLAARLAGRDDVVVFGRLSRPEALAVASQFDVAPYARTVDEGIRAAKVSELIGLGVPVVSYDYEVTANLRETGAGILVPDSRAFVDAVVTLLTDDAVRGRFATVALEAGRSLDWDLLARRFEHEVLDIYLPPS
jgi:glycosyltransferase involved in cell wall biosynthesis